MRDCALAIDHLAHSDRRSVERRLISTQSDPTRRQRSGVFFLPFFLLTTTAVSTVAITIAIVNQRLDAPFSSAAGGLVLGLASYTT